MNDYELIAEPRTELGSRATRRLRRAGKVPAVLYGGGESPLSITLSANSVKKQTEQEAFYSHVLSVKVGGNAVQAVLKDLQRDPTTAAVTHMDLQRIIADQPIDMLVPIHFVNEDKCIGKKAGGVINHLINELEVHCLPRDLPEFIDVDVSALDIGDSIHLSEIKLPPGVELQSVDAEQDQSAVSVTPPLREEAEVAEGAEAEVAPAAVPTVAETDEEPED